MGVLARVNDIIRSNLNELLNKAENPERLLRQGILDMEEHLRKAQKQVQETIAAEKHLEKKKLSALEGSRRWERRAELALRAKDEDMAKQALLCKNDHDDLALDLEEQIKVQREYIGALKQSLASLDGRLNEARARKNALIDRVEEAKRRKKNSKALAIPDKKAGTDQKTRALDTFDRMEDKVMALEAKVEALAATSNPQGLDPALDAKFVNMEKELDIEEQLSRLKKQVGGKKSSKGSRK